MLAISAIHRNPIYSGISSYCYNRAKWMGDTEEANRLTLKFLKEQISNNYHIRWELRNLVNYFFSSEDWENIRSKVIEVVKEGSHLQGDSLISFYYVGKYYVIPINRIPRNLLIPCLKRAKILQPEFEHKRNTKDNNTNGRSSKNRKKNQVKKYGRRLEVFS